MDGRRLTVDDKSQVMKDKPQKAAALHAFLRSRRSIRRFKPDPISEETIQRLLETAVHAPSAHNLQPWRFALVQSEEARRRLGRALTDKMRADMQAEVAPEADITARVERSLRRIAEAPVIVLFCRDRSAIRKEEPEEHTMGIQSVANMATYLALAAHAEGLAANWICWPLYAPEEVRAALDLPVTWEPQGMLFLGWPAEEPGEKVVREVEVVRR